MQHPEHRVVSARALEHVPNVPRIAQQLQHRAEDHLRLRPGHPRQRVVRLPRLLVHHALQGVPAPVEVLDGVEDPRLQQDLVGLLTGQLGPRAGAHAIVRRRIHRAGGRALQVPRAPQPLALPLHGVPKVRHRGVRLLAGPLQRPRHLLAVLVVPGAPQRLVQVPVRDGVQRQGQRRPAAPPQDLRVVRAARGLVVVRQPVDHVRPREEGRRVCVPGRAQQPVRVGHHAELARVGHDRGVGPAPAVDRAQPVPRGGRAQPVVGEDARLAEVPRVVEGALQREVPVGHGHLGVDCLQRPFKLQGDAHVGCNKPVALVPVVASTSAAVIQMKAVEVVFVLIVCPIQFLPNLSGHPLENHDC
mmetsp:Transcript_1560/g.2025  ORF Transcript_1560/g.2025 Transcript_1560/m.2025 type:complete len:359 (-) Transcript_1560:228-1304(-)